MSEIPDASGSVDPSAEAPASPVPQTGERSVPVPQTGDQAVTAPSPHAERQPVVKVRGARRARLLPAPGTSAEPAPVDDRSRGASVTPEASGPNDERLRRDVPPHY